MIFINDARKLLNKLLQSGFLYLQVINDHVLLYFFLVYLPQVKDNARLQQITFNCELLAETKYSQNHFCFIR